MEISLTVIFSIIIIHWIADFIFQSDYDAKNKSTSNKALLSHTLTYSLIWFITGTLWSISSNIYTNGAYLFDWWIVWKFTGITFIAHTITDYFTSRLNSKLWAKGDVHNFFVSIGFDQVLHYVQLILTFKLLIQ